MCEIFIALDLSVLGYLYTFKYRHMGTQKQELEISY